MDETEDILRELGNVHYPTGFVSQKIQRYTALKYKESDELRKIYHLIESHVPGLRFKTILRSEKMSVPNTNTEELEEFLLHKNYVGFDCTEVKFEERTNTLLRKLEEMPKEWMFVQLTPGFNPDENINLDSQTDYTNSMHIAVLDCGNIRVEPFCVIRDAPKDKINGEIINLTKEMRSIVMDNKDFLGAVKLKKYFSDPSEKIDYRQKRSAIDERLKEVVKCMQDLWLGEWRCLLVGKFIDSSIENEIELKINEFLEKISNVDGSKKVLYILKQATKSSGFLKPSELKQIVQYCLPELDNKNMKPNLPQFLNNLYTTLSLETQPRHPVIIILDDALDCFPWEMINVLVGHPVSRVPSLHFAYSLYKRHKDSIRDGYKIVDNYKNGSFILNPNGDLGSMERRMKQFFAYWVPNWKGSIGCVPLAKEFEDKLILSEIFSYNGHGSGSQFLAMEEIQKLRLNAVVLLFGCGSVSLLQLGPQTEMVGVHQMYMIAGSPCTVGMLWEVTDLETDQLTAEFLSTWIPNLEKTPWKYVDKKKWALEDIEFQKGAVPKPGPSESELLRALCLAKKSNIITHYLTKAACVAKGIPVRISHKSI